MFRRDVMFDPDLHRGFVGPHPLGLEPDHFHVVGHMLPVRMGIALAFLKGILTRLLPMNQAHGLIIGDAPNELPTRAWCVGQRYPRC